MLFVIALGLGARVTPGYAQQGYELGLQSEATIAGFTFLGGGVHVGLRPGGRARFALTLNGGGLQNRFALRGEAVGHFLLNPSSTRHGIYAGGGLAGLTGRFSEGFLLLVIGLESNPGGRSGWLIETGIGGGVRLVIGYTWRSLKH